MLFSVKRGLLKVGYTFSLLFVIYGYKMISINILLGLPRYNSFNSF